VVHPPWTPRAPSSTTVFIRPRVSRSGTGGAWPGQHCIEPTPDITHLTLILDRSHAESLVQYNQRPAAATPHVLSHRAVYEHREADNSAWSETRDRLKEQLCAVWCEQEDDVVRWRADLVWRTNVGLPDQAEDNESCECDYHAA